MTSIGFPKDFPTIPWKLLLITVINKGSWVSAKFYCMKNRLPNCFIIKSEVFLLDGNNVQLRSCIRVNLEFQRLYLEFSRKVRGNFRGVQWFSFKSRSYCWLWEDDQPFLIDSIIKISLENWENLHPSGWLFLKRFLQGQEWVKSWKPHLNP